MTDDMLSPTSSTISEMDIADGLNSASTLNAAVIEGVNNVSGRNPDVMNDIIEQKWREVIIV